MNQFCKDKGIKREFSVARTPQQNGVAERRNRTLIEAARTMDNLGKFEGKANEEYFVGYSVVSKAMRVFNKRTMIVEETLNIRFKENAANVKENSPYWLFDIDSLTIYMNYVPVFAGNQTNGIAGSKENLVADEEAEDVDVHLYRSMIGSLMYLIASRPDITFSVCACANFQVNPKTSHLYAVKRIFRYLKGQPKLGLWYPKDLLFDLESYSDSDYARASLDRKSRTEEYVAAAN
nr:hypothetical protein [Tanacetum cinerariifolium]